MMSPFKKSEIRLFGPAHRAGQGTTNQAGQPLMVVVLVVWAKTGAALIAREAATKRVRAGFLRMCLL
jgi:hypothetical protein